MLDPFIEATVLRAMVLKKEVRPREVAEFFLERVAHLNPRLGAFITVTAERALADADRLEKISATDASKLPLFGVPYSLKDLLWTKDIRTTFGSKNFENWHAPVDAELAVRLAHSGGILLGKTTTPEFGLRPTTEGGLCPAARNPWNLEHTAGGSSGGSAAAVAGGLHPIAQGSDGGGSIRIPAACCGLVGIKPSRGRVTMAPQAGEGWGGLSTTGPIARTVRDAALMLDAMAGQVPGDPYAAWPPARPFFESASIRPKKLGLALITESSLGTVDPETLAGLDSACAIFRQLGHTVEPIAIDPGARLNKFARVIVGSSVAALDIPNPDLLDPVVRGSYDWGSRISAADYVRAIAGMHNTSREIVQALMPYDALLAPTLTQPAVRIGSMPAKLETGADEIYAWIAFTFPFNSTGQPAISMPNGFSQAGLPLAIQIIGRPGDEGGIIALAAQFEEARPWHGRRPTL
ncbi:MAG: amidase [Candidatus Binatus sp.]|uniref:amidase n=1 Tax=Candidatus Binatus sp. TaxID=2811406 RepID=UPI002716ADD5|nr:amidase [Candidatus Binatus sp.]MDO8432378.1 amidase [Candidatus Binatus sp.]